MTTIKTTVRKIMVGDELKVVSGTKAIKVKKSKIPVKGLSHGKNSKHSSRALHRNSNHPQCLMDLDSQSR